MSSFVSMYAIVGKKWQIFWASVLQHLFGRNFSGAQKHSLSFPKTIGRQILHHLMEML
jgi:hypothetical protein